MPRNPRDIFEQDQSSAAFRNIGMFFASTYAALIEEGVPSLEAAIITAGFAHGFILQRRGKDDDII